MLLSVSNLSISFNGVHVVSNISFTIAPNSILGVVGESGSGKSLTALAILGLLPTSAHTEGTIYFNDNNLLTASEKQYQNLRSRSIAMIFQEPMTSLNPTMSCGYQVSEVLKQHTELSSKQIRKEVLTLFKKVKLPRIEDMFSAYPHQISGGQKQRVMIAMALACKPELLIADEPTTALDVTVQKEIIALLKDLQKDTGMSILFITHDLALVSEIADDIVVMYRGTIIEKGAVDRVFLHPEKNYTKALINSKPSLKQRLKKLPTVTDFIENTINQDVYTKKARELFHQKIYAKPPLLEVKNLEKTFITEKGWFTTKKIVKAVDGVSFKLYEGETLGLVGESGCGKTTLGRTILHLEKATAGQVFYKGIDILALDKKAIKALRKDIQIIFQDPFSSLNPRISIGDAIMEPMTVHGILTSRKERKAYVISLLKKVGLLPEHFSRYPHEFSGGQRQRIGIARTIALQPRLIICDESVSALDVSVQAQVLNLLNDLKSEFEFSYIFISHDLSVVKYMSDQLVVMNKGRIEEINDADTIYEKPTSAYTQKLIDSIPKGL